MTEQPLYRRVLGEHFGTLCPQVRRLHDNVTAFRATGRADIGRGANLLARLLGWLAGMPPAGADVPLAFDIAIADRRERWTRDFGGHRFSSVMWNDGQALFERLGPVTFEFRLEVHDGTLSMLPRRGWALRVLPLPRFALPTVRTVESCANGKYRFEVEVVFPIAGKVVEYRGELDF